MDISKIIGKAKETITDAGQYASSKAKDGVEVLRLKNDIRGLEKDIDEQIFALGKGFFEANPALCKEQFPEAFNKIMEAQEKIAADKKALDLVDSDRHCPTCGKHVAEDEAFCTNCGAKLDGSAPFGAAATEAANQAQATAAATETATTAPAGDTNETKQDK